MQNPRAQGPKGLLEKPCGMILPLMNYGNHISRGQCTPNKLRHVFIYIPFFFSFIFWWIYHDGTFLLGNLWDSASRRIIYQDDDKQGAPTQSFLSFISYIYIYIRYCDSFHSKHFPGAPWNWQPDVPAIPVPAQRRQRVLVPQVPGDCRHWFVARQKSGVNYG